ncbi:MAG TPA: acyl-CoA dehydrogenase family protein, partial [Novosphingobium sp.]|nr:acyl-CoA dehydrogenase family protein [Novosphingobium sp.]
PRLILYFIALHHVPGTLLHWGSEAQRQRHLPAVLGGDEIWCQGFSEPGAGSDLAALRTRAVRKGDHYVVNGQKTWSSNAHLARYCLLLARTDPDAPKTRGISYFILDLQTPGVTLRPIKQMTGASHFNEIFLDDVAIPAENLIGPEHGGWAVAQSTLSSERGLSVLELAERMREGFKLLLAAARMVAPGGRAPFEDDEIRRRLVDLRCRIEALRLLVNNQLSGVLRGASAGVEPSIIKLYYSDLLRDFTELGVTIGGIEAQYLQAVLMGGANETGYWMQDYLYSWAWTISGGSSEIQRNIIAERGLKLPREPQAA